MQIGDLFPKQMFYTVDTLDNRTGASQLLGRFGIGDEFLAKILEIGLGELVMQLSDGTVMNAAFDSNVHLRKGDWVKLGVKGKKNGQLLLKTVETHENSETLNERVNEAKDALRKQLMSIGIKPDRISLKIAREFIKMNVVPDKDMMAKVAGIIKKFGGLDVRSAVFLAAKGIEPSAENVACLMRLRSVNSGIGQRIHELANLIINSSENVKPQNIGETAGPKAETASHKAIADGIKELFINVGPKCMRNIDIKNMYRDIYTRLSVIKREIAASGMDNKDAVIDTIDGILNDIRFINEINKQSVYVQIPVVLQEKQTTCELYVLKRRKAKGEIDPGNTTMLISLDTENLGRIDSLISLTQKNVDLSFKVMDKNIMEFIKLNTKPLYQRLTELGYRPVEIKCGIKTDSIDFTNVDETVEKELIKARRSIDCRV